MRERACSACTPRHEEKYIRDRADDQADAAEFPGVCFFCARQHFM